MKKLILILTVVATLVGFGCASESSTKKERKIAVQTYTFNAYTLEDTVGHLKNMGVNAIECYPGQMISAKYPNVRFGHGMNKEQREFVKKLVFGNGFKIIAYGVTNGKTEAEVKAICDFAKEFKIPLIVTEAPMDQLPLWEKICAEYGVKMCIHNHQRGSGNDYYKPELVMGMVKDYKNIGVCPDNGAWSRSGLDPVKCFRIVEGKIFEVHLKDQVRFNDLQSPAAIYGTGVLDMKGILAELDRQGFDGYLVIEHGDRGDTLNVVKNDVEFLKNN